MGANRRKIAEHGHSPAWRCGQMFLAIAQHTKTTLTTRNAGLVVGEIQATGGSMRWLACLLMVLSFYNNEAFAQEIPFRLVRNMLLLPVSIGGEQLTARLDTGGAFSIMHPDSASRLGLRTVGKVQASGLGGKSITYDTAESVAVGIGDRRVQSKPLLIIPLSSMADDADTKVDITLGRDIVGNQAIEIDFDRSVVRFTPSSQFKPMKGTARLAIRRVGEDRTIETIVTKWGMVRADFDTGNPGTVEMTPSVGAKALDGQATSQFLATGIDGKFVLLNATLPSLTIAGVELLSVPVAVRARPGDRIGLGMDILKRFNLTIDLARDQMWMTPNAGLKDSYRKDGTGIWTDVNTWPRKLLLVSKGSPAEQAGLKPGDMLAQILDESGKVVDHTDYLRMGEALTVVTVDGRRVNIVTADYF
jgi:hypothetical protein